MLSGRLELELLEEYREEGRRSCNDPRTRNLGRIAEKLEEDAFNFRFNGEKDALDVPR